MEAYILSINAFAGSFYLHTALVDSGTTLIGPADVPLPISITTLAQIKAAANAAINQFCIDNGITVPNTVTWFTDGPASLPTASTDTRSIVTGTGATGFQLSSTKNAMVSYAASIVTAATLLNGAVGSVVLEIAPTNSATAGDWVEIGRITNGQVFSLAVAIGCTQTIAGTLSGFIPAGYYAKLRSINTTGTPTYNFIAGQKVLY